MNPRVEKSAKKLVAKIILKWKSEDNCGVLCKVFRYKASCSVYIKVGRSLVVAWLHSLFGETWSWCVAQRKLSLCKVMLEVLWMRRILMAVPFHNTYQQLLELPQAVFKRKKKEKFKSYCNIVLFLLPGESFRKKLNNKKGSPFVWTFLSSINNQQSLKRGK